MEGIVQGDLFVTEEQKADFQSIDRMDNEIQNSGDIQYSIQKQDKYKWPENIIPYIISSDFSKLYIIIIKESIGKALKETY